MSLEGDLKRYYKEIRKHLLCSPKAQIEFLAEVHRLVADFLENQPDATFEDIVKNVGEPTELAETFLDTLPDKTEVERFHQARRKRKRLILVVFSLLIVILLAIIFYIGQARYHTIVTKETTTVIGTESNTSSVFQNN